MLSARKEFWTFKFGSSVVKFSHPCCDTSDLTPWHHLYHTDRQVLLLLASASGHGKEVIALLILFRPFQCGNVHLPFTCCVCLKTSCRDWQCSLCVEYYIQSIEVLPTWYLKYVTIFSLSLQTCLLRITLIYICVCCNFEINGVPGCNIL
jgi:hypothetical protein